MNFEECYSEMGGGRRGTFRESTYIDVFVALEIATVVNFPKYSLELWQSISGNCEVRFS